MFLSTRCWEEPQTARFLTQTAFSALALQARAVQRQDDSAYLEQPVLLLELLQLHIPGHQAECEFWPVRKDFSQPRQSTQSFEVKRVRCLISMCIAGCYFLCMCWFSNRCFLFQEILNERSFLWRCIHTATAQTHANFVYISQAAWQRS